jgi:ABC-type sugar transport system ATPase subunit
VREPKLFLFDEPLASLDAKLRESMAVEIHRLQRRLNVTMLYVTHDQVEAMSLADRIVVLDKGRVLQTGTPEEIYRRPNSPRVARMLGSPPINLLSADQCRAVFPRMEITGQTIGIRPEHLLVSRDENGPARIRVVEHLGAVTVAYLSVQQGEGTIELRAILPADTAFTEGNSAAISVAPGDILTFQSPA